MFELLYSVKRPNFPMVEQLPITVTSGTPETYSAGEAVVLSSGKATKCGQTALPTYITVDGVAKDGKIACYRVEPGMHFRTTIAKNGDTLVAAVKGTKLKLNATGTGVLDVTTSGVLEVVSGGTADGGEIIVRV